LGYRRSLNWRYRYGLGCSRDSLGGDHSLAFDGFEVIVEEIVVGTSSKLVIHGGWILMTVTDSKREGFCNPIRVKLTV
jgi:hypothetical protein